MPELTTAAQYRAQVAAAMSEATLLQQVRTLARTLGYRTYHTHDSRRSEPGFPDLVLVGHGRIIYAELKTARGRVTPDQILWLTALAAGGGEVHVWRPMDLVGDAILRVLKGSMSSNADTARNVGGE